MFLLKVNLLEETLEALEECNVKEEDILWVQQYDADRDEDVWIEWKTFKKLAANIEYDAQSGHLHQVDGSLIIIGSDWWFTRWYVDGEHGYEREEGWTFNTPFVKERPLKEVKTMKLLKRWAYNDSGKKR